MRERPVAEMTTTAGSSGGKAKRRLHRWLIGVAVVLGLVYFVAPIALTPYLRGKLQAMVSGHLNARLTMGRLAYHFPYGVTLHDAALVARDERGQDVDLFRVKTLDLALAKLPLGRGPLVIKRIVINEPSVRFVVNDNGLVGAHGLVKDEVQRESGVLEQIEEGRRKPSDYFRLRRFEIHDGQVMYEDRRAGGKRPPVVWKNLGVDLDTLPASGSMYQYELSAKNAPMASANVRGTLEVDALLLQVERFVVALRLERGGNLEQLPPQWQEVLKWYDVDGALTLSGSAKLPLRDLVQSAYEMSIELPEASARVSAGPGRVDRVRLKARVSSQDSGEAAREVARPVMASEVGVATSQPTSRQASTAPMPKALAKQPPARLQIDLLEVGTHDTVLHVEKGEATIDPASDQWRVKDLLCRLDVGRDRSGLPSNVERLLERMELSGSMKMTATAAGPLRPKPGARVMDQVEYQVIAYPRDVVVRPPNWGTPFSGVSGTVRVNQQTITLENVEARFKEDRFFVTSARVPLGNIENELRIQELDGSANLTGRVEDYGRPFEFVARQVRPSGTFYAIGNLDRKRGMPPGTKPEYRFDIRSDAAGATLGKRRIPVSDAKVEIVAATRLVEVKRIEGKSFSGTLTAEGQVTPGKGRDLAYEGNVWLRDVDVKALADHVAVVERKKRSHLSGRGSANARVWGTGADAGRMAIENFRASGRFEILDGDFWSVPVVDEIAGKAKAPPDALTVGRAAGVFEVHDQVVELRQAALSAPVLGVQGDGRVAFDGRLDLHVVAAPLADWKDGMKRLRIPVVSDVAGEVLGTLQKMINTAEKTLLYEFRVSGTTREPKVEAVPTPVLTDGVAKLFGAMARGERWDVEGGAPRNSKPGH